MTGYPVNQGAPYGTEPERGICTPGSTFYPFCRQTWRTYTRILLHPIMGKHNRPLAL